MSQAHVDTGMPHTTAWAVLGHGRNGADAGVGGSGDDKRGRDVQCSRDNRHGGRQLNVRDLGQTF